MNKKEKLNIVNDNIPIYNKLMEYNKQNNARFHVPGHKGGFSFLNDAALSFDSILGLDLTELSGLDNLHNPQGIIAEAQQLAAKCFKAEHTYFLVNGSTVGNIAMILSTIIKGDQVIVQRNSHQSVFHGLALAEAEAILLEPTICPLFEVPVGLTFSQLKEALHCYPEVKAIILTYPNYYGMAAEIKELIEHAHQNNLLVLVDEAHGAHFGQSKALPPSAMQLGADISVQSTHKMLSSMTMTSMLHVQGDRVCLEDLQYYLRSLQSSSPSYPLLASLDVARAQLEGMERKQWDEALEGAEGLRSDITVLGKYIVSQVGKKGSKPLLYHMDPFKLLIQPNYHMTGYQLQATLEEYGIYPELSDPHNVLLTLPIMPNLTWNSRLIEALQKIAGTQSSLTNTQLSQTKPEDFYPTKKGLPHLTPLAKIKMKVYRWAEKEEVPLQQAVGRIAAEMITPYPPGIPIFVPGEEIKEEMVDHIKALQKHGAFFQGKGNIEFDTILVAQGKIK
jgi:arginine decarboxylase